jgi:hypothetical protein
MWLTLSAVAPWVLSDNNAFLRSFVNHEFLSFMGVIVTITLASAANLFIEMNKLEEKVDEAVFRAAKNDVKHSAYTLVGALIASILLVIIKPLVNCGPIAESLLNGVAITIIIFSVMILIDLTQTAFSLDPYGD